MLLLTVVSPSTNPPCRFTWVSEGLYLDEHTSGMSAEMVTYNAELRVFGATRVTFDFQPSGSIQASYRCVCVGGGGAAEWCSRTRLALRQQTPLP